MSERRGGLKPIEITQPHGPSFTIDDDHVLDWLGWKVQVCFDSREGLVLRDISVDDRKVVDRASIAEMVVPYADPSPQRWFQTYFDGGEYLLGNFANSSSSAATASARSPTWTPWSPTTPATRA